MSGNKGLRVPFKAPLKHGDTETVTVGCRANNPDICANNGLEGICAFASIDGMCRRPSKAWRKQFLKLEEEGKYEAE